jgi:glucose-6-phosphate 1-dehydrogenase
MAATAAEVVVEFRRPPSPSVDRSAAGRSGTGGPPPRGIVRFRLGHYDGVTISLQAKTPGRLGSRPVSLSVDFDEALGARQDAYERLLDDVMDGSHRRFPRWDAIQQQWRIVAHTLDLPGRPTLYSPGSWGPTSYYGLGHHRWHPLSARKHDGQDTPARAEEEAAA